MNFGPHAMDMERFALTSTDLAPGDLGAADYAFSELTLRCVASRDDPLFEEAYARLWQQFGAAAEVETPEVLGRRLAWNAAERRGGFAMLYELWLVQRGGEFLAVRDHTAIADAAGVVVHLSHLLIAPAGRRTGLASWLRALPIHTARRCLERAGLSPHLPITLAAEMEYLDGADEARMIRLRAYEKSGFRKIDPGVIDYWQPDFRAPNVIDASGGARPLRFQLVVRRVGQEEATHLSGAEVRAIVERFYAVYAQEFRPQEMAGVLRQLEGYPPPDAQIALLAPTA